MAERTVSNESGQTTKKAKVQKIKDRLSLIFGLLFLIALLVSFILTVFFRMEAKNLKGIQDTTAIEQMAYQKTAESAVKLLQIYDEASYQSAKKSIPFDTKLSKSYFSAEHYGKQALYYEAPKVKILSVQSNYPSECVSGNAIYDYLIELEFTNPETQENSYPIMLVSVQHIAVSNTSEIVSLKVF